MFETIKTQNRKFKEINKRHTMICINDVQAISIFDMEDRFDSQKKKRWVVSFEIGSHSYYSEEHNTEAEAIKFRDEIMEWNNSCSDNV